MAEFCADWDWASRILKFKYHACKATSTNTNKTTRKLRGTHWHTIFYSSTICVFTFLRLYDSTFLQPCLRIRVVICDLLIAWCIFIVHLYLHQYSLDFAAHLFFIRLAVILILYFHDAKLVKKNNRNLFRNQFGWLIVNSIVIAPLIAKLHWGHLVYSHELNN